MLRLMKRFSTAAKTGRPELPDGWEDTLFNRVAVVGNPRRSVVPVLDGWIKEGRSVGKTYLQGMVKRMRYFRRYTHALQISMWMSDNRYFNLTPGDHADRLQMISKFHVLDQAEKYFSNLPKQFKGTQLHNVLLNCYVEERETCKAEDFFHNMRESNMLNTFAYNVLMKLYININKFGKVDDLLKQMKKDNVAPDLFSYNFVLVAHAHCSNIDGIEDILEELRRANIAADWYTYANAGKGYVQAGLFDKASLMLTKSKKLIPKKKGRIAYGFVLTQFAEMGKKDKVYEIWNLYKAGDKVSNTMYMCMMSGLLKMDDFEGAETIMKEWEAARSFYDFAVPNVLLSAYCKKGDLEKAESLLDNAVLSGRKPYCNSWDKLTSLYFAAGQKFKAVEVMRKSLSSHEEGMSGWKPNPANINAVFEFFAQERDVEAAEEFLKLLKNVIPLTRELYRNLLKIYMLVEKPVGGLMDRIREDGFEIDQESIARPTTT